MKKIIFILAAATLFAASCQCDNTLTKAEKADGWQLLFNGKDLSGWRDYNGTELTNGWTVVDGCIRASGNGGDAAGYIVTDRKFADFILSWDWKLTHGGNSGMLYHVQEDPVFAVPYVTGPEYQLIDNEGEWNNSMIVFDNGHVEHWLNGEKILEFEAWTDEWFELKGSGKWADAPEYGLAAEGVICLQDHGDPASFKNIKIKELPHRGGSEEILFNGKDLSGWEPFGDGKWYVDEEGNLVTETGENCEYGYLCTRKYYKDFDLSCQFKEDSNGNSGLFFHSFIEGYNYVHGWQCEVAPLGCDTAGIYESYGRGWLWQIPDEKENILKQDDWNDLRIRIEGGHVQTWLNGELMTDIEDEAIGARSGRLMLQIHDNSDIRVLWRNFHLTNL